MAVCISQITYAICVGSYAAIVNEITTISSIVIFFVGAAVKRKNDDNAVAAESSK